MSEEQIVAFPKFWETTLRMGFVIAMARINLINELNQRGMLGQKQSTPVKTTLASTPKVTTSEILPAPASDISVPVTAVIDTTLLNRLSPERRREMIQRDAAEKALKKE